MAIEISSPCRVDLEACNKKGEITEMHNGLEGEGQIKGALVSCLHNPRIKTIKLIKLDE